MNRIICIKLDPDMLESLDKLVLFLRNKHPGITRSDLIREGIRYVLRKYRQE